MSDKLAPVEKHAFSHQGRTVYEWDQTLSDINIYVELPSGVSAKQLYVSITNTHIRIGIQPNPPYLDVSCCIAAILEGARSCTTDAYSQQRPCCRWMKLLNTSCPIGAVMQSIHFWPLGHAKRQCLACSLCRRTWHTKSRRASRIGL